LENPNASSARSGQNRDKDSDAKYSERLLAGSPSLSREQESDEQSRNALGSAMSAALFCRTEREPRAKQSSRQQNELKHH
jgi:hypothetical protein